MTAGAADPFRIAADRLRLSAAHEDWYDDPVGWAEACIEWPEGEALTEYQQESMRALVEHKRIAVRGPHGLGKTAENAILILWFACTRDAKRVDWKIATTAGAWRQLEKYLWPEVHKWAKRLRPEVMGRPQFSRQELLALNLKLTYGQAFAVASDDPQLIEGVHADAVLYVFDESKSIIPGTFDAAEGAFSGAGGTGPLEAFAVAVSTPGEPNGRFYDIHTRKPGFEDWWTKHVTVQDTMKAGRVSAEWVEQRRKQWGEDSAIFANRVLGEFHSSDEDGTIPLAWVEAANERWREWEAVGRPQPPGPRTLGVDVARSGADKTVRAPRDGDVIRLLQRTSGQDTMATTGLVVGQLDADPTRTAIVDVIGVGAGVVDRLREMKKSVVAFNASEGTNTKDRSGELGFLNCRSAAWWHMRELLDPSFHSGICLPPDDGLLGDLVAPRWKVLSGGKIQVESKDDIRRRIGRSTDDGDAVVMAFWDAPDGGAAAWIKFMDRGQRPEVEVAPPAPALDDRQAARQAAFKAGAWR